MRTKVISWLLVCIIIILTSCAYSGDRNHPKTDAPNLTETGVKETVCSYEIQTVIDDTTYKNSTIKYPNITEEDADFSQVNKLIRDSVLQNISDIIGEDTKDTAITLNYSGVLINENLFGALFEGSVLKTSAAHPTNFAFSVHVSIKNEQVVDPLMLFEITPDFIRIFREQLHTQADADRFDKNQWKSVVAYLDSYSDDEIVEIIRTNTKETLSLQDSGVTVMFPVPHAIGDYIKISVPYAWGDNRTD